MHLHILGICGTFMGSLAVLAKELGYHVTGSDANVYPPMSTQLEAQGITLMQGYDPAHLTPRPDLVVVGNAMGRGNPAVEYMLNEGIPYTSGPAWLAEHVLRGRHVIGVAGTHGKTTTTTMVAWILEQAGQAPGFLIGGVPNGFSASARLGSGACFVVEADEYDSAFFDKRSKFIHYAPTTAILNNLEFDHADIFENLEAIKKQFHHLVRTIPGKGCIIVPADDANLADVLAMGVWTPVERFTVDTNETDANWRAQSLSEDGSSFAVFHRHRQTDDATAGNASAEKVGEVHWTMTGRHSVYNGLAAIMAAHSAGVSPEVACQALSDFPGVKRRMEIVGEVRGIMVYDDFAHHPTAIATTLQGLRRKVGTAKIIAIIEPRSNTMRLGAHKDHLALSVAAADQTLWYQPEGLNWDLGPVVAASPTPSQALNSIDAIIARVVAEAMPGNQVVIMSNGSFGGIHQKLIKALQG